MAKKNKNKRVQAKRDNPGLVNKYMHHLHVLSTGDKKLRKAIIDKAPLGLIKCISEICKNSLVGNIQHTDQDKLALKQHKRYIRILANKSVASKHKRGLISQKGGFLPLLVAGLLGTLGGKMFFGG